MLRRREVNNLAHSLPVLPSCLGSKDSCPGPPGQKTAVNHETLQPPEALKSSWALASLRTRALLLLRLLGALFCRPCFVSGGRISMQC